MKNAQSKEMEQRDFILNAPLWEVILKISLPLIIYNSLNHYFGFFDTLMVAHISRDTVSAVAYMSQLQFMLSALGTSLAMGGGIIVARHIGSGDYKEAKKNSNIIMTLAIAISTLLILIIVPFAEPILRIANTPEELIQVGSNYFRLQMIMTAAVFINNVYIAVEKSKGNTKEILYYNLMVFAIKLSLTAIFVYGFGFGINMVAVASIISQLSLTIIGIRNMRKSDNYLRLEWQHMMPDYRRIKKIVKLAFPIFIQRFAFSFGKVVVNSMSVTYGSMTVGALGISNRLGGCITNPPMGIQDGESTIISQNLGNKNVDRALETFKKALFINILIGIVGLTIMFFATDFLIGIFAVDDQEFAQEIFKIFKYERIASVTLAASTAVMGFLYGFGYTKVAMVINIMRLFLFRIPVLYGLIHWTNLGSESVGITMLVSNVMVGVTAIIASIIVISRIKKKEEQASA